MRFASSAVKSTKEIYVCYSLIFHIYSKKEKTQKTKATK